MEVTVKLLSPISTTSSQKGDQFTAQVRAPEKFQGAAMEGHVQSVKRAKGSDKAEIAFALETITVGGASRPIQAHLKDITNSHRVKVVDEEGKAIGKSSSKKKLPALSRPGISNLPRDWLRNPDVAGRSGCTFLNS